MEHTNREVRNRKTIGRDQIRDKSARMKPTKRTIKPAHAKPGKRYTESDKSKKRTLASIIAAATITVAVGAGVIAPIIANNSRKS